MPNNYTVHDYIATEAVGDNVADGTFPSTIQMSITPHSGYALRASDFSLGNSGTTTTPPYYDTVMISSVVFTDSVGPLDPLNNVIVTLSMTSIYEFSGSTYTNLDIDGNAHLLNSNVNFVVSHINNVNVQVTQTTHPT